jgi:Fe-S cluster assembly iron-binding protein IscA
MALDEPEADEKTIPVNGLDVLISDMVQDLASETTIDYVVEPYGEGFIIDDGRGRC